MRVHVLIEWLNGDELDDDTLFALPDEVAGEALDDGYLLFSKEPLDLDKEINGLGSYVIINLAATRRVEVTEFPEGAEPSDNV